MNKNIIKRVGVLIFTISIFSILIFAQDVIVRRKVEKVEAKSKKVIVKQTKPHVISKPKQVEQPKSKYSFVRDYNLSGVKVVEKEGLKGLTYNDNLFVPCMYKDIFDVRSVDDDAQKKYVIFNEEGKYKFAHYTYDEENKAHVLEYILGSGAWKTFNNFKYKVLENGEKKLVAFVEDNNKYQYIDWEGKEYACYDSIGTLSQGRILVKNKQHLYGYVDEKGKEVIPCQYKFAADFIYDIPALQSLALTGKENKEGLIKYIDTEGKTVERYDDISKFHGNPYWAIVSNNVDDKENPIRAGYINLKGELVIPLNYYRATFFVDSIAIVDKRKYSKHPYDEVYDYYEFQTCITTTGSQLCKWYTCIYPFSEGLAAVRNEYYDWGFINKQGKLVIPFAFDNVFTNEKGDYGFYRGEAKVLDRKNLVIIDRSGRVIRKSKW